MVIRIWCENNYQANTHVDTTERNTSKKRQYTLTILPAFLIPCSCMLLPYVYTAIIRYIYGHFCGQYEAAFSMGAQNRGTFQRYYYRYLLRTPNWTVFISAEIIGLGGTVAAPSVKDITGYSNSPRLLNDRLKNTLAEYFTLYAKIPGNEIILEDQYFQTMHCKLCLREKGLGP